ncbi:MAG: hypothetical protein GY788_29055 [bacterium]|nr:hypothetical protein [bacterium]
MAWEEARFGRKDQLGLLYIVLEAAIDKHWRDCGLKGAAIDASFLNIINPKRIPKRVQELFRDDADHVADVLNRLELAVISWSCIRGQVVGLKDELDVAHPGEQTLYRLLDGFLAQLDAHRNTGIT